MSREADLVESQVPSYRQIRSNYGLNQIVEKKTNEIVKGNLTLEELEKLEQ